jgi:hypothetical protein
MKKSSLIVPILAVFMLLGSITTSSCTKEEDNTKNTDTTTNAGDSATFAEKMFALYVLNQPVKITLAVDSSGTNLTPSYSEMEIYLRKETYYKGPLEILVNGTKYVGTWDTDVDYYLVNFYIEGMPEFEFFKKTWTFTYKSMNLLKIVPYRKPGKKIIHLEKI